MLNKILFNFSVFMFCILLGRSSLSNVVQGGISLLIYIISVGALGYFINDLFDIQEDKKSGRKNEVGHVSKSIRIVLILVRLGISSIPVFVVPKIAFEYSLLVSTQLALFVLYSAHPIRLKSGAAGLLADACFSFVIPGLLAFVLASQQPVLLIFSDSILRAGLMGLLFLGIRSIGLHQIKDVDIDRQAGVKTFTTKHGEKVTRIIATVALIAEVVCVLELIALSNHFLLPVIINSAALYVIIEWGIDIRSRKRSRNLNNIASEINQFYNIYLFAGIAILTGNALHVAGYFAAVILLLYRLRNELLQLTKKLYYSVVLFLVYKIRGLFRRLK